MVIYFAIMVLLLFRIRNNGPELSALCYFLFFLGESYIMQRNMEKTKDLFRAFISLSLIVSTKLDELHLETHLYGLALQLDSSLVFSNVSTLFSNTP
jgi:hypothetical protein